MGDSSKWSHLIHFESAGQQYYGDLKMFPGGTVNDVWRLEKSQMMEAEIVNGDPLTDGALSGKRVQVDKILPILSSLQVPFVRCIGLNYSKHIEEVGRQPPSFPTIFVKPSTAIAGYGEEIPIPQLAQGSTDYEGELVIVIGKAGRDIKEEDALNHVAGYLVGNDVSCRQWQRDKAFGPTGGQWSFSKGFDKWAPLGPVLVSPSVVGNAGNLDLFTQVNGEMVQKANTSDLLFGVEKLVSFCSQGTTLETGSMIMTGTPSGVISGKPDPVYLKDGDVVRIKINGLSEVENVMRFE